MDQHHNESQLVLKSISELMNNTFIIQTYQRGYRWTKIQVEQLLSDINEFANKKNKQKNEFYCLQPIVVKKLDENKYEVIDGQQRLTTLYILLKYFENKREEDYYDTSLFSIEYVSRAESKKFLENIKVAQNHEDFIDFYFLKQAYISIENWFKINKDKVVRSRFLEVLIQREIENHSGIEVDIANNLRVIWYEVPLEESSSSIDIFTRLNIGKISLTNAELIKATLLQRSNLSNSDSVARLKQIQIATEWDLIEKRLQDDSFWFFIYNTRNFFQYENRIEYIFDLIKNRTPDKEKLFTFLELYNDLIYKSLSIDQIWNQIKSYFLILEEWYSDNELYHYVGFLIDSATTSDNTSRSIINELKTQSVTMTKEEFKNNYIFKKIADELRCENGIEEISYGDPKIKKILLMFNIQTILETQKSDMRFPFYKYKNDNWEIEHVSSQTDKILTNLKQKEAWRDDMLIFFFGNIQEEIDYKNYIDMLEKKESKDIAKINICRQLLVLKDNNVLHENTFEQCFNDIHKYFNDNEKLEDKDGIGNLTLLDAQTNRSYKNSFYPSKRQKIIENDKRGLFIPIATKNLFLKYYSTQLDDVMFWKKQDFKDYVSAIKKTLKSFLCEEENNV